MIKSFVYTNVVKTDVNELYIMFLLGIGDYLEERYFNKKTIKITLDGFLYIYIEMVLSQ